MYKRGLSGIKREFLWKPSNLRLDKSDSFEVKRGVLFAIALVLFSLHLYYNTRSKLNQYTNCTKFYINFCTNCPWRPGAKEHKERVITHLFPLFFFLSFCIYNV